MKKTNLPALFAAFLVVSRLAADLHAQVVVNEYSCANLMQYSDTYVKYEDWIELYNPSDTPVDISGYHLSDNENKPTKWKFPPGAVINAKGFFKVFASGRDEVTNGISYHTNFKISQTKKSRSHRFCRPQRGDDQ
ncbi:MAG: lamin tail domain-containing protein [Lewinellaceae bacterium]|nr:lamin tail domain-containing protein [Lewinellaceae bacterium]